MSKANLVYVVLNTELLKTLSQVKIPGLKSAKLISQNEFNIITADDVGHTRCITWYQLEQHSKYILLI